MTMARSSTRQIPATPRRLPVDVDEALDRVVDALAIAAARRDHAREVSGHSGGPVCVAESNP